MQIFITLGIALLIGFFTLLPSNSYSKQVQGAQQQIAATPSAIPSPTITTMPTSVPTFTPTPTKYIYPTLVPTSSAGLSNDNYYINSNGNEVHSPASSNSVPHNASARCKDGEYSFSQHRQGTCSGHGGVAEWL